MEARLNLLGSPLAAKSVRPITSAGEVLADSTLPAATQELVRLRASQRLPNSCTLSAPQTAPCPLCSPARRQRGLRPRPGAFVREGGPWCANPHTTDFPPRIRHCGRFPQHGVVPGGDGCPFPNVPRAVVPSRTDSRKESS